MSNLKAFDGSWTCEGKSEATPVRARRHDEGHGEEPGRPGRLLAERHGEEHQAGMPGATMEGMFHMTYDPGAKQYVLLWVDNMGAYSQRRRPAGKATRSSSPATCRWAGRR